MIGHNPRRKANRVCATEGTSEANASLLGPDDRLVQSGHRKRFVDQKLVDTELGYKRDAHKAFVKHFGHGRGKALLEAEDLTRIAKALDELYHATNIPSRFEIMAVHYGLKDRKAAAGLLRSVLGFVDDPNVASFARLVEAVSGLPAPSRGSKVLTWPNVTILPFLANPKRFMVLKPSITKRMARRINFDLLYSSPRPGTPMRLSSG